MEQGDKGQVTVLVVEDIDWIRAGMEEILRRYGYRVREAANAAAALKLAENARPDLILTEEKVPTLYALTARLRAHPTLASVPVVIVNPDAEAGARDGDIIILPDYDSIGQLLAQERTRANGS